jgi:hypothetical protein
LSALVIIVKADAADVDVEATVERRKKLAKPGAAQKYMVWRTKNARTE